MKIRASLISASIADAVTDENLQETQNRGDTRSKKRKSGLPSHVARYIVAFFALFRLRLKRFRPATFLTLRHDTWKLEEEEYLASFPPPARKKAKKNDSGSRPGELVPIGDLGYSGSTFFATPNSKFLIKSLPRRAEYDFFTRDLLAPYAAHMDAHPASLLVRIVDLVRAGSPCLGGLLGTAPTHHIIMENLLYGKPDGDEGKAWETYDLKPEDYFFPERDIADGRLAPDSVKDRLVDTMPDKVIVSRAHHDQLVSQLEADTALLASHSAVDYSLFLVRYPIPEGQDDVDDSHPPTVSSDVPCSWREGVKDLRGTWAYRAIVLDFFWAKSRLPAKAMTGLINTWNLVARQGPMSITAEPQEYRERFLKMVDGYFEARD